MNRHNLFTSSFKNLIFGMKLVIALSLLCGYIYYILPQYEQGYNASLIDKVNRLESIDSPKIVLLGHSNLTFGIDSALIENEMEMPVVNMGLHGGNGNAFHEEMAKYNVVPGDIYVLCHSDYNDNDMIGDPMNVWTSIENHFDLWKLLRFHDVKTMVKVFPVYLKKSLGLFSRAEGNQDPGGVYSRNAFNEYGDIKILREEKHYVFENEVSAPQIGSISIERINRLNTYLTEKGAALVVAGYPIGNGNMTDDVSEFISFQEQLEESLDCPVISNYVDYMFDYRYFYDTNFHLNTEGARLRTIQLISDLKRWEQSGTDADIGTDQYIDIVADANLSHLDDIYDYLEALQYARDRYTVFISAKKTTEWSKEVSEKLDRIGLSVKKGDCDDNFVAIVERGNVIYENITNEKIEVSGEYDNGLATYSVVSGDKDDGYCSSIIINGQEYSRNVKGMNFVVYSNETHRILDEAAFEFHSTGIDVIR